MNTTLEVKKYKERGDLAHEYNPLENKKNSVNKLTEFTTTELNVDLQHPINIECQESYDGTVNLILNDDINPPRIINTRFTVLEDNQYKIINRNQLEQSNVYKDGIIDRQTRLFRNLKVLPQVKLRKVTQYGQLMCGNYTFYIKYADSDDNLTDIVAESGIVSIFKGNTTTLRGIAGGALNERTDKAVSLQINNVDTTFQKIYVYFVRETCDLNGVRLTTAGKIKSGYDIRSSVVLIDINGFEEVEEITPEELNVQYNIVNAVKTQTQVQNMLFFGNVQQSNVNVRDLQNISLYIKVQLQRKEQSLGWITSSYTVNSSDDLSQSEYYNPINIYYYTGYWPGELYRLGIVYIYNDDSLSPVFNLRGCEFLTKNIAAGGTSEFNYDTSSKKYGSYRTGEEINYIPTEEFIDGESNYSNTRGVFKLPDDLDVYNHANSESGNGVHPIGFKLTFPTEILEELKKHNVKGYFIVRQKRIPITIAQGFSIGVDRLSHTPMLCVGKEYDSETKRYVPKYISESFLDQKTSALTTTYKNRQLSTRNKQSSGLLCLEASCVPEIQSYFDGSEFILQSTYSFEGLSSPTNRHFYTDYSGVTSPEKISNKKQLVYIGSDVPLKYVNGYGFSTRAGASEDAKQFVCFNEKNYDKDNRALLRGVFTPYIGVVGLVNDNTVYNIRSGSYSTVFQKEYFSIRMRDNAPYFAISDRYELNSNASFDVYRGDCYTSTVTFRMQRNFVDPNVPTAEDIVDPETWSDVYKGLSETDLEKWADINLADINTVPIGTWVTFKVLSNYNLGLRVVDSSHTDEYALMGNARSFYPYSDQSVATSNKIDDSWLLNAGNSATVGVRRNFRAPDVPYIRDIFDTRVMFSNVEISSDFKNGYRIFQGLSYKDIDRQYGGIVKLLSWGSDLLCIFEHGIGVLPVNEKALLSTTTGQSIHLYGAGVLQEQVSLITSDFGSIWQDSIIKTTVGVYGVDTYAKKIWRVSNEKGLELLSDTKIQRFLNEGIQLAELDKYPILGLRNVKTHFNNNKGDVIFTFYNENKNVSWSICYNERFDKWITRYSWTPLFSENIDNQFFSLDKKRAEVLSYIYYNKNINVGLRTKEFKNDLFSNKDSNIWSNTNTSHEVRLLPWGYDTDFFNSFKFKIHSIESSYLDDTNTEVNIDLTDKTDLYSITSNSFKNSDGESEGTITLNPNLLKIDGKLQLFYLKIKVQFTPVSSGTQTINASPSIQTVGIVVKKDTSWSSAIQTKYDQMMQNGFYVHGRAGIFDEINYNDYDMTNQILPTKWYDKQEPFEFEFVVNNIVGAHKIFNDLVIISNNVQPKELEFEIIGDVYDFNKAGIYKAENFVDETAFSKIDLEWNQTKCKTSQEFRNVDVKYDNVTNKYSLVTTQPCYDIKQYGRRIGNIHYKEDAWYVVIEPIKFKKKYPVYESANSTKVVSEKISQEVNSTRIRDKFLKIRVKYSGEDLAIISNLRTLMTLSYA